MSKLKEALLKTKKDLGLDLTEAEEKELDIFIDSLVLDLQNKFKKIDYKKLAESFKEMTKEKKDE